MRALRTFFRLAPVGLGFLALLAAFLSSPGCASSPETATPDPAALYARRCSLCHAVRAPTSYPSAVWAANIQRYGARAGLTRTQRLIVLEYLRANASDAPSRAARSGGGGS